MKKITTFLTLVIFGLFSVPQFSLANESNLPPQEIDWKILLEEGDLWIYESLKECLQNDYKTAEECYLDYISYLSFDTPQTIGQVKKVCQLKEASKSYESECLGIIARKTGKIDICENNDFICLGSYVNYDNAFYIDEQGLINYANSKEERLERMGKYIARIRDDKVIGKACFDDWTEKNLWENYDIGHCLKESVTAIDHKAYDNPYTLKTDLTDKEWSKVESYCKMQEESEICLINYHFLMGQFNYCEKQSDPKKCIELALVNRNYDDQMLICKSQSNEEIKSHCLEHVNKPDSHSNIDAPELKKVFLGLSAVYFILFIVLAFVKKEEEKWLSSFLWITETYLLLNFFIRMIIMGQFSFFGPLLSKLLSIPFLGIITIIPFFYQDFGQYLLADSIKNPWIMWAIIDLLPILTLAPLLALFKRKRKSSVVIGLIGYLLTVGALVGFLFLLALSVPST